MYSLPNSERGGVVVSIAWDDVDEKNAKPKKTRLGPRVTLDDERCILCSRCVRFTHEISKSCALGIKHRGDESLVRASGADRGTYILRRLLDQARRLRALMPDTVFLVPGYGAQGGTADDVRACFIRGHQGALITASRSVIYPKATLGTPWKTAIGDAARIFADEIRAITR